MIEWDYHKPETSPKWIPRVSILVNLRLRCIDINEGIECFHSIFLGVSSQVILGPGSPIIRRSLFLAVGAYTQCTLPKLKDWNGFPIFCHFQVNHVKLLNIGRVVTQLFFTLLHCPTWSLQTATHRSIARTTWRSGAINNRRSWTKKEPPSSWVHSKPV